MRDIALFLVVSALWVSGVCGPASAQGNSPSPRAGVSQTPIGKVVTTKGSVTILRSDAVVVLAAAGPSDAQVKAGDSVYERDTVLTGADSAIGIVFTDGTAFNLSANTRMVLDEFVYDPKSSSNSTLFSVARGTFTFITGKVAGTGQMKVNTPVATMGIRGTSPHVEILDNGTVRFSTLIEEGKKRDGPRPQVAPSPNDRSRAMKEQDRKLRICRGC